jgi:hypothetical protein
MRKNYLYALVLGLILSYNCFAQFPSPYCEINEDYWAVEEITTISFDGLPFTNTNTTSILVDHTNVFVEVERGESYTISLKGNTHGNYDNEFVVFVDWNQNGILDDTGEVYYIGMISNSSGYDSQSATATITVPANALYGSTRARITKTYTDPDWGAILNIDPCYISYYDDWDLEVYGSYGQAVDITVNVLCDVVPTPIGDTAQEFTPGQTLADLDVTGQGLTWFTDEDLENLIEPSLPLEHGATYYVVSIDGVCQSSALAITVTDICFGFEAPTAAVEQDFYPGQTLADLEVTGEGLIWYADSDLEDELEDSTQLEHGMIYYVVSTNENCQSEALAITVTDICFDFAAPEGEATQEFNSGETLADLEVMGEGLTWYADEELTEELEETTTLVDQTTYYVTASNEYCESTALVITVTEVLSTIDFGGALFSYYPNPVSDVLYLNTTGQIDSVVIYNMLGQKIQEFTENSTIDMSGLSKGNYLVNVTIGNTSKTIRIVKQ